MKKIRNKVFETNSSSTHSLIFCTEEEYNSLQNNSLYIDKDDNFITEEEYIKLIVTIYLEEIGRSDITDYNKFYEEFEYEINEFKEDNYNKCYMLPKSLEEWFGNLEEAVYHYTSKSEDKIIAITKFGYES